MNFASDNVTGAAPEIIEALSAAAAAGPEMPYGADSYTARAEALMSEVFEKEVSVFFVATGTAANSLSLSQLVPPYGGTYCHEDAHIQVHEAGAPEYFGGKLIPVGGEHAKLTPAVLQPAIAKAVPPVHHVKPSAVSITQASESGTVYTPEEIKALASCCQETGMRLHMDGARFANAVASMGVSPAETTWKAGVDALSFGATKNGTLAAEAVVFFNPADGEDFAYRRKRGGHLFSKMRFLTAQWEAYLSGGLWLALADHANAMAARLGSALSEIPAVEILHPVEANMVFAEWPVSTTDELIKRGFVFYAQESGGRSRVRLVMAFNTSQEDVEKLIDVVRGHRATKAAQ